MRRHFFAAALAVTTVACSGKQTLYLASDRPEELSVKINGTEQEGPLRTFHAYGRVKLTKGAEVIVTSKGTEVEHLTLPAIEEGQAAIVFVGGAPSFKLIDYKNLGVIGKGSSSTDMHALTGIGPGDIEVAPIDTTKKYLSFDERSVVVGPDAPMPKGGAVNQFTLAKFPIYRVERVPPGADPFETIKPRVNTELGLGKFPGTTR